MLIFNQIYKKFLIQYVLFNLNIYRNLQTPHKNTTFEPPIKAHIMWSIKCLIMCIIKAPVMGPI